MRLLTGLGGKVSEPSNWRVAGVMDGVVGGEAVGQGDGGMSDVASAGHWGQVFVMRSDVRADEDGDGWTMVMVKEEGRARWVMLTAEWKLLRDVGRASGVGERYLVSSSGEVVTDVPVPGGSFVHGHG